MSPPRTPRAFFLHGRYASYTNQKCRCDLCREAFVNYQRGYRARRREAFRNGQGVKKHGTQWSYKIGCRCIACRAAVNWHRQKALVKEPNGGGDSGSGDA